MKAKDTMSKELQDKLYFEATGCSPGVICGWERDIMSASFGAGMQKVAKFIDNLENYRKGYLDVPKWQAFKKENGLK